MSNKEEVTENIFENFKFLSNPIPASPDNKDSKDPKETEEEVKDDEKIDTKSKSKTNKDNKDLEKTRLEAEKKALEEAKNAAKSKKPKSEEEIEESEEEEIEVEDKEEDTEEEVESPFRAFASAMGEKGILEYNPEDFEDTEEGLDKVVLNTIKSSLNSYKSTLPEDAQEFLKFVENGGDPAEFHKYYYQNELSFEDFDISEEENGKYAIRQGLELEGYSKEEIDEEIENIDKLGNWEKKASIYLKKLQLFEKDQKKSLLEAQEHNAREQEKIRQQEWNNFKDGLYKRESIGGFKITDKVKNDLWDYMTKPVNRKTGETQYQIDSKQNEDARYMFAYLLKNKWDIKSLEKQVTSKEVSKLRSKLSNYSEKGGKSGSSIREPRNENKAEFSAFKEFLKA